jgi:hypothetical protein
MGASVSEATAPLMYNNYKKNAFSRSQNNQPADAENYDIKLQNTP